MNQIYTIRHVADVEKIETIPHNQRVWASHTFELIEKGASIDPEATALSFIPSGDAYLNAVRVTYRELIQRIRQSANLFHDLGVGAADVVSYLLPNLPQTHFVLWGAEAAGIVNPINPLLEAATIRDICRAAGTKVLVALGNLPGTDIWQKALAIYKDIPTLKAVIWVMGKPSEFDDASVPSFRLEEKLEQYPGEELQFARTIHPDDISSLYHTGGTTGTPKLARRTHFNEVIMAWDIMAAGGITRESTLLGGLPLFHVNGTTVTGLTPFSVGAHVVMLSPRGYRDPGIIKNFYRIVERFKANFFSAVPTVLGGLLEVPVEDADISSLQYAICGAAPLSVEMFRRFEKHTGMKVLEGYGLTEGACASCINPKDGERKVGSIGIRLPYQKVRVGILDDSGSYVRDARPGEIGTIMIKGPNIFKGYVEDVHNEGIWLGDGNWFNTGDLGRMDEDGYFWLTGRKKELIIRGGHNIDPATIEEALYQHPDVKVAAAVGRPDPHSGELPVAYVELVEGSRTTASDLLRYAGEKVGERAAVPKEIIIVDQVPLTPVGKIFKPALRWNATEQVYARKLEELGDLAAEVTVKASEDKRYGTRVDITIRTAPGVEQEAISARTRDLLALFTLHYQVKFA